MKPLVPRDKRPEAHRIQDVMKEVVRQLGGKRRLKQHQVLAENWSELVGETVARHTKVVGIRQRVIQVKVDSAPLLNELAGFKKAEILKKAQDRFPEKGYQDINFRP